jgi:DNA (cytosine-5)-methyltransferase 1
LEQLAGQPPLLRHDKQGVESFELRGGDILRTIRGRQTTHSSVLIARNGSALQPDELREAADQQFLRAPCAPNDVLAKKGLRVADLFCGCGGMSLGVREAFRALGLRFQPILAADLDRTALDVYTNNFDVTGAQHDLSQISSLLHGSLTPFEVRLQKDVTDVDFLIAGPPCQGHSNLNNHTRRNDPKNELYFKVARFAKLFTPTSIVIENVTTVRKDKTRVVDRTVAALTELGYFVSEGNLDLAKVGVPQNRRRHVLLASRVVAPPPIKHLHQLYGTEKRTVRWAIEDLEGFEGETLFDSIPGMTQVTKERIDHLFENEIYNLPDAERPSCHKDKVHGYRSVYGRMNWDDPAPTITRGFMTMGQGRFVHPGQRRTLTPHEAARIQYFPDFFKFDGVKTRKGFGDLIGNAVPSRLSYIAALELLR